MPENEPASRNTTMLPQTKLVGLRDILCYHVLVSHDQHFVALVLQRTRCVQQVDQLFTRHRRNCLQLMSKRRRSLFNSSAAFSSELLLVFFDRFAALPASEALSSCTSNMSLIALDVPAHETVLVRRLALHFHILAFRLSNFRPLQKSCTPCERDVLSSGEVAIIQYSDEDVRVGWSVVFLTVAGTFCLVQ